MNKYNNEKYPIIKLIDKENGGHGSTINVGIETATGKYTRIIDGDDWVNSIDLDILIERLESINSDIVITDYSEDIAFMNQLVRKNYYDFLIPGLEYNFEDLCDENYGFRYWGPILATGNFKTKMLKDTNFKLTEKSFYVDMEFDLYSIVKAETLIYYPLDIYRYFIGRAGQSISQESFLRNYKQHENVLFNIIEYTKQSKELSENKKNYIYRLLIEPMANAHYIIVSEYSHKPKMFMEYDNKLKKYPEVYNMGLMNRSYLKINRKTKGLLLPFGPVMVKIYNKLKRIYNKIR